MGIAVASNNIEWRFYSEGILDGSVALADGGCNPDALDHAVTLVGYSDETAGQTSMEYKCDFSTGVFMCQWVTEFAESEVYWKIQNSWGPWWGEDGFMRIDQQGGKGVCGMNQIIFWVQPDLDAYV